MDYFNYTNHTLHAESVSLATMAESMGTPFYCYSTATLTRHYDVFAALFDGMDARICYAMKANDAMAVVATLAARGAGVDVVSQGEIMLAQAAGVAADQIVFSGVGKTREEMGFALRQGIYQFNVESEPELLALHQVASAMGVVAPVALRINPDVDPKTHAKISTGQKESKFGIDIPTAMQLYARRAEWPAIRMQGVSVHIGSQLLDLTPFEQAFTRVAEVVRDLLAMGVPLSSVDVGGGFGIRYHGDQDPPSLAEYVSIIRRTVGQLGLTIICEPGRMLVGNAGVLVSRVLYVKQGASRKYLILDAGMNDLMRPTLYSAYHEIMPICAMPDAPLTPMDVVGPVCETGDLFAEQRPLPPLVEGDLVAFRSAGAYGAVMAGTYNARPRIAEAMVHGAEWRIIRPRGHYEEMIHGQQVPEWL